MGAFLQSLRLLLPKMRPGNLDQSLLWGPVAEQTLLQLYARHGFYCFFWHFPCNPGKKRATWEGSYCVDLYACVGNGMSHTVCSFPYLWCLTMLGSALSQGSDRLPCSTPIFSHNPSPNPTSSSTQHNLMWRFKNSWGELASHLLLDQGVGLMACFCHWARCLC